jgi:hypothetical protein
MNFDRKKFCRPDQIRNRGLVPQILRTFNITDLVTITLFASDLIPEGRKIGGESSDLKRIGSKGRTRSQKPPFSEEKFTKTGRNVNYSLTA